MANIQFYNSCPVHFALAFTVSEILTFLIFDLHKVGQDHRVEFSQLRHLMANIKICKSHFLHFLFLLRYDVGSRK